MPERNLALTRFRIVDMRHKKNGQVQIHNDLHHVANVLANRGRPRRRQSPAHPREPRPPTPHHPPRHRQRELSPRSGGKENPPHEQPDDHDH